MGQKLADSSRRRGPGRRTNAEKVGIYRMAAERCHRSGAATRRGGRPAGKATERAGPVDRELLLGSCRRPRAIAAAAAADDGAQKIVEFTAAAAPRSWSRYYTGSPRPTWARAREGARGRSRSGLPVDRASIAVAARSGVLLVDLASTGAAKTHDAKIDSRRRKFKGCACRRSTTARRSQGRGLLLGRRSASGRARTMRALQMVGATRQGKKEGSAPRGSC